MLNLACQFQNVFDSQQTLAVEFEPWAPMDLFVLWRGPLALDSRDFVVAGLNERRAHLHCPSGFCIIIGGSDSGYQPTEILNANIEIGG